MSTIVPVSSLGRAQEHGRLRFGVKTAKAMKALETWRFTSSDQQALGVLAEKYGGIPRPWDEPKAAVQGQWELLSEASEIEVLLPAADSLSIWYEKWTAAGCERRCDGDNCTIPTSGPDGDTAEVPCLCAAQNLMSCKAKVRLSVILPSVEFRGVWRMETGSWNAAHELSAMAPLVEAMQGRGILRARLVLERRKKPGKSFIVPKLVLAATPEELASGQAGLPGIPVVQREIESGVGRGSASQQDGKDGSLPAQDPPPSTATGPTPPSLDDDIVDGEIIEPSTKPKVKQELARLFNGDLEECAQAWAYANGDEMEWDSGTARTIHDRWNGRPM